MAQEFMTTFKEHGIKRVIDLAYWVGFLGVLWIGYSGWLLGEKFRAVVERDCAIIQTQALDKAVEAELAKRPAAIVEPEEK